MPSVDVVIPCYNYAHLLPRCVASVLMQGVERVRVIIIDNASADDSIAVARRLAAQDGRIEVIRHAKNIGPHGSFNEGIDLATAEYMMILCADDVLVPGALGTAIRFLERNPEAACAIGAYDAPVVGELERFPSADKAGAELVSSQSFVEMCCRTVGLHVAAHALLVRTGVQKAVGHYRECIYQLDDLEMALRLAGRGPVAQLSIPLAVRQLHSTNISVAMWHDRLLDLQERLAVFDSFFLHDGQRILAPRKHHRIARRRLGAWAYWSGLSHAARGRYEAAAALFRFALRQNPICLIVPPVGHLLRTEGAARHGLGVCREAWGAITQRRAFVRD